MKASKVSELLAKINSTIAQTDLSKPSNLQIDLVKDYLRQLYDMLDEIKSTAESDTVAPEPTVKSVLNPNKKVLLSELKEASENTEKTNDLSVVSTKQTPLQKENSRASHTFSEVKASISETTLGSASLNEKHKSATTEVHKKFSSRPLKDLIDLNKKFILLNELFKANADAYLTTINHLDGLQNFEAAETFIKNELLNTYQWDEKSQPVRMFVKLVKQKFGEE